MRGAAAITTTAVAVLVALQHAHGQPNPLDCSDVNYPTHVDPDDFLRYFRCNSNQGTGAVLTRASFRQNRANATLRRVQDEIICSLNSRFADFDFEVVRTDPGTWLRYHYDNRTRDHVEGAISHLNVVFPGANWVIHGSDIRLLRSHNCTPELRRMAEWMDFPPTPLPSRSPTRRGETWSPSSAEPTMMPTTSRPTVPPPAPLDCTTVDGVPNYVTRDEVLQLFQCNSQSGPGAVKTTSSFYANRANGGLRLRQDRVICALNSRFPDFDFEVSRGDPGTWLRYHTDNRSPQDVEMAVRHLNELFDGADWQIHPNDRGLLTSQNCNPAWAQVAALLEEPETTTAPITGFPSYAPSMIPSYVPTNPPTTRSPSSAPSAVPTTAGPTSLPTMVPTTNWPTIGPSGQPTLSPTVFPTLEPTENEWMGNGQRSTTTSQLMSTQPKGVGNPNQAAATDDATSSSTTLIAVVVVVVVLLVVVAVSAVFVLKRYTTDARPGPLGFENPLYASNSTDLFTEPTDIGASVGGDVGGTAGYMDIPSIPQSSGYMDVQAVPSIDHFADEEDQDEEDV